MKESARADEVKGDRPADHYISAKEGSQVIISDGAWSSRALAAGLGWVLPMHIVRNNRCTEDRMRAGDSRAGGVVAFPDHGLGMGVPEGGVKVMETWCCRHIPGEPGAGGRG